MATVADPLHPGRDEKYAYIAASKEEYAETETVTMQRQTCLAASMQRQTFLVASTEECGDTERDTKDATPLTKRTRRMEGSDCATPSAG